jgi:hypothetical protein
MRPPHRQHSSTFTPKVRRSNSAHLMYRHLLPVFSGFGGLHHELAHDLQPAAGREGHRLALVLHRTRGRQAGDRRGRKIRQHWVARGECIVHLQCLGLDTHHPSPRKRSQHAHLRHLHHVRHLVRLQVPERSEHRRPLRVPDEHAVLCDHVQASRHATPGGYAQQAPRLAGRPCRVSPAVDDVADAIFRAAAK